MNSDERPDSLAAQAASWVPPWEREPRPVDRDYQAATADPEFADPEFADPVAEPDVADPVVATDPDVVADPVAAADSDGPADPPRPDDDEDRSASSLSDDDDDFDGTFEGPNPPGYGQVPPELPPVPGESGGVATVDAPTQVSGEGEAAPTDIGAEPEVPLSAPIESAASEAEDDIGQAVDAPLPVDGDDAAGVFDAAADDDVSDDADVDLPCSEVVPDPDADETQEAADDDGSRSALPDEREPAGVGAEFAADASVLPDEQAPAGVGAESAADAGGAAVVAAFRAGQADAEAAYRSDAAAAERSTPRLAVPEQGRRTDHPDVAVGAPGGRTGKDPTSGDAEPAADGGLSPMDDAELRSALEAILLVVDEPVAEMQLAQILEQPTERVGAMLEDISARYTAAGHGFDLRRAAGGWRLYTRPEYAAYVERFVLDGQSVRLTQAALETLAVVAYKQPVTRSRISAIRGVNCDGVMRTLVTRGLIEECGIEGETGAYLYRTTPLFLEKLGLNSVDQLPPLAPFLPDDVEEVLDASG